jgi:hypothetical protein
MNMVISSIVVPHWNSGNPEVPKKFFAQAKGDGELTLKKLNKDIAEDSTTEIRYLRDLIAELHKNTAFRNPFGFTPLVDRLEKENNDCEQLHTKAKKARRERGTLTVLVAKTNASFDILSQIVNGLSLMPVDADAKAALEEIVGIINGRIHQYTVVYNRHAGVVSGKKKGEGNE